MAMNIPREGEEAKNSFTLSSEIGMEVDLFSCSDNFLFLEDNLSSSCFSRRISASFPSSFCVIECEYSI